MKNWIKKEKIKKVWKTFFDNFLELSFQIKANKLNVSVTVIETMTFLSYENANYVFLEAILHEYQ